MTAETCQVFINVYGHVRGPCGRPAEGHLPNGKPACGSHLVETCKVWRSLGRNFGGYCGRPAIGHLADGKPACAQHLAGERRRLANDQARREKSELRRIREADHRAEAARLGEALGLGFCEAAVAPSGYVLVDMESLHRLVERIEALEGHAADS